MEKAPDSKDEKMYSLMERLQAEVFEVKGERVCKREIFDALFIINHNVHDLEMSLDLWNLDLTFEGTREKILNFNFNILRRKIEIDSDIFPEGLLILEKVQIKDKGKIWVIHKYDQDDFPSKPHAHQLDSNLKLDLSTGNLYKKKRYCGKISKKALLSIRGKATEKNIALPDLNI